MNTRNKKISSDTELLYIGSIGFLFEVNQSLIHNLISPSVLAFFEDVSESENVTTDCAFPLAKPNTSSSIFQYIGHKWIVCSDGIFRKCNVIKCNIRLVDTTYYPTFYVDYSLSLTNKLGKISTKILSHDK